MVPHRKILRHSTHLIPYNQVWMSRERLKQLCNQGRSENPIEPTRKLSGSGWGRIPQRAQRDSGRGECRSIGVVVCICLGLLITVYQKKNPQKGRDQSNDPTHTHAQVENATASPAPSAGVSPDRNGDWARPFLTPSPHSFNSWKQPSAPISRSGAASDSRSSMCGSRPGCRSKSRRVRDQPPTGNPADCGPANP